MVVSEAEPAASSAEVPRVVRPLAESAKKVTEAGTQAGVQTARFTAADEVLVETWADSSTGEKALAGTGATVRLVEVGFASTTSMRSEEVAGAAVVLPA